MTKEEFIKKYLDKNIVIHISSHNDFKNILDILQSLNIKYFVDIKIIGVACYYIYIPNKNNNILVNFYSFMNDWTSIKNT